MSNNNNSNTSFGGLILGLLGITFIVLKLTNYIDWSWWWITAPFWMPFAFAVVILLLVFVFQILAALWIGKKLKKPWK